MSLLLVRSPRFREHDPGQWHPERPERLVAIDRSIEAARAEGLRFDALDLRPATELELLAVHHESYLTQLEEVDGRPVHLDADTSLSSASVEIARLAAGTTIDLVSAVAESSGTTGMALIRPPGHHAVPDRAMGFCLLSNLAVAVKYLLERKMVERVAIYDWDVHHGNGTQAVFYDDPRVLFMSSHQWPFYPGTGSKSETGIGKGAGTTINVPLPAGTGEEEILRVTDELLAPQVRNFSPDLILISAGYDGHQADPLGGFGITTEGFRTLATRWRELATELCDGRIAGVLEGGYDLDALGSSVRATLEAWA